MMQPNSPTSQGSVVPDYSSHQQQTPTEEHDFGSPPPYTSSTNYTTSAKMSDPFPKAGYSSDSSSSISNQDLRDNEHPLSAPTRSSSEAYTREPPMSTASDDPWGKYENTPGCCCSTTGGCCFSSRGGCCFSDTEGCCFSSTKGCCFSSDAACCFSNRSGSLFPFGKVCLLLFSTPKALGC